MPKPIGGPLTAMSQESTPSDPHSCFKPPLRLSHADDAAEYLHSTGVSMFRLRLRLLVWLQDLL